MTEVDLVLDALPGTYFNPLAFTGMRIDFYLNRYSNKAQQLSSQNRVG